MRSRQIGFYLERGELPELMAAVREQVLVRFEATPHFMGTTVLKRDAGERAEIIITSFWDDGLEGSEVEATRFISEIRKITGASPTRKGFDTLYAQVRDSTGNFHATA
jgi:hypothetical protein